MPVTANFNGYLTVLKTAVVLALKAVFNDDDYPEEDFAGDKVYVGIEYPTEAQMYPGVWIDYEDTADLTRAGINHEEEFESGGLINKQTRWRFGGDISFTVVALTSLERDRLYDELVRIIAFGPEDPVTAHFRSTLEDNDLLALNANFDTLQPRGGAAAPGTPWGSDEFIYERSLNFEVLGEFIMDPVQGTLVPLSAIEVTATEVIGQIDPVDSGNGGVTDWH